MATKSPPSPRTLRFCDHRLSQELRQLSQEGFGTTSYSRLDGEGAFGAPAGLLRGPAVDKSVMATKTRPSAAFCGHQAFVVISLLWSSAFCGHQPFVVLTPVPLIVVVVMTTKG